MSKGDVSIKVEITEKRPDFIEGKAFDIKGVTIETWGFLARIDKGYNKNVFKVKILMDKAQAESFAAGGFNVKRREDGQHYLEATRKEMLGEPEVVGQDGKTPVDGNKVGNGSKVNLKVWAKYNDYNGLHLPLRLNKVQVVELVEYESDSSDFEPVGGGNTGDNVPF